MRNLESTGSFITIAPNDPLVAKHVAYYYFHASDDPAFQNKFIFYPNYNHALTAYLNSDVKFTNEGSVITGSENSFVALYSVNTCQSFSVCLSGRFYKIGVVFKPLGINNFISKPLCDVFTPSFSVIDCFGSAFEAVVRSTFNADAVTKVALLDDFFKNSYHGFYEPVVKKAVQEILNTNGAVKVEYLSEITGVNRKTLLRLFKKHLCASVEEYKKLVMFRNALNYAQQAGNDITLTDVAVYNLYYDQAHYIKHFKAVTQQSPKSLLSKLTRLGNRDVYWRFED